MKNRQHRLTVISFRLKFVALTLFFCIFFFAYISHDAKAAVETSFLYNLSNINGPIPYSWAKISVDQERNEIYAVGLEPRHIRVFNEEGMEIYRFGDDYGRLGLVIDVAVKKDGNILAIVRKGLDSAIILCNFRGEPISELELKDLPPEFSPLSPDRIFYLQERLYLLNSTSMKIVVTDTNGLFQQGFDIRSLVEPLLRDKKKIRGDADVGGFSVDHKGNMLFTIPTLFLAFKLSPEGELIRFGQPGSAPGRFGIVGGIVADDNGNYYVADRLRSVVIIFDKNFNFLSEFGYRGFRKHNLIAPKNLALDSKGRLYVAQVRRRGVSVFKITLEPERKEAP